VALPCIYDLLGRTHGRRKASKSCGGQASRGTVSIEKAPKNFSQEMLATGGGGYLKKISGHTNNFSGRTKKFSGNIIFFPKITKFFRRYKILPKSNRIFREIQK
jgi:hypothetical protein